MFSTRTMTMMSYLIKLTNTLVFQIFKRGTTCTLIPYCTKGGTQALKVRNRGGCKNNKNISFLTSTIHFIYNIFLQPKYTDFTKRFLRSTVDVQGANTFPLHNQPPYLESFPLFWVIRSFPIPLETIKRGGDFYFDLYKSSQSNGLVLNTSTATVRC